LIGRRNLERVEDEAAGDLCAGGDGAAAGVTGRGRRGGRGGRGGAAGGGRGADRVTVALLQIAIAGEA